VRHGYAGDIAIEPFDYVPDGPGAAARAIGTCAEFWSACRNDEVQPTVAGGP
jgi:hypothetical protein